MSSSSDSSNDSGRLNLQKDNSKELHEKIRKRVKHKSRESKHNRNSKDSSVENVKKSILNDNTELQKTKMPSQKFKRSERRSLRFMKHKSDATDMPASNNTNKKKDITEESECCSNSEAEIPKKHVEKTVRKRATSKSSQPNFVRLHNEEADSSSGQEFQKSKISLDSSKFMKKLSRAKEDCMSSTSSTEKQAGKNRISKDQSLYFKSKVIKILNRFKTVCSEYELQMEQVKWKHFKKELIYQESANNVIQRSKNVINKLKMELDDQENKLMSFAEEWNKKCCAQDTDHDDSSSSNKETIEGTIEVQNKSNPSNNKVYTTTSEGESIVSGCDSKEIFSENEVSETANKKEKKRKISKSLDEITEKGEDDNDENTISSVETEVVSPTLGSNTKKLLSDDTNATDNSEIIDRSKECSNDLQEDKLNDSLKDIFDESVFENDKVENTLIEEEKELKEQKTSIIRANNEKTQVNADLNDDDNSSKGNELNRDSDNTDSEVNEERTVVLELALSRDTISTKTDDTESVETVRIENDTKHSSSDELDDEEKQAKRALLESDSEIISNDESASEKSGTLPTKTNLNEEKQVEKSGTLPTTDSKEENQVEKSKHKRKGRGKGTKDGSVKKNSRKGNDITELSAKRALLDSNSDDSIGSSSTKGTPEKVHESDDNNKNRRAKASLLDSSNSESSTSDDGNSLQFPEIGQGTSSEKQKPGDEQESLQDESAGNSDCGVSERDKKRRHKLSNKCDFESDKKLQMQCCVVLKRLPKEILVKHAGALEKSRQHMDSKQIKSLINLDRLQRNTKKTNDLSQSSTFKQSKPKEVEAETEDTLLDHLKKVENGELAENIAEDAVGDTEDISMKSACDIKTNEELMEEADKVTKNLLLNFDDSDIENQNNAASLNGSSDEEKKLEKIKSKSDATKSSQKAEKKGSASDEDAEEKREKRGWRRNKLLTVNFSTSDSEIESAKWEKKQEKLKKKAEENKTENSDVEDTIVKRKRRLRRKILDSDSDVQLVDSDSDSSKSVTLASGQSSNASSDNEKKQKMSLKRKTRKSSDTDSSLGEKKVKPKRKRIKRVDTDSDDDSDEDAANSQGTPGKKGRKNIRKVLKDKQVADDTKLAAKEEEERLKRIEDRQKLYNEMYEARLASEEKVDKLVLDFNAETKEELVSVHPDIVKCLKPHQAKGIKFMWDACFESLERIKSTSGTGCIIAHCMGLGKSLQVIALAHTLLTHEETGIKTIMIVCPLSTVLNWYNEFKLWLKDVEDNDVDVYELTKVKKCIDRKFLLQTWHRTGGILLIGYEMFRNLTGTNNKMRKTMKEELLRYLIDPGPDLIVCDEGHLLKNEDTALSKSMRRIKTLRRIILTGTPLQNNLIEYHCMVQFVKPSLLGTKKEFLNRFANPINNGQYDDSTEYDVKLMKKRAYVLHKMLKGCVQRYDYSVLTPFLPPKQEYVIFVRLSDVQIKMYRYYLENLARRQRSANGALFADFQTFQRIWTHPVVLRLNAERIEKMNEKKFSSDSEGSLRDFINDDTDSNSGTTTRSSSDENDNSGQSNPPSKISRCTRSTQPDIEPIPKPEEAEKKEEDWWTQFVETDHFEDMSISSKLMLLFGILKECEHIGDKVLVFSQSLYSLTLIERFLGKIDDETQKSDTSEYMGYRSSWTLGLDYFRLDGQTSAENRSVWCKIFNSPSNTRARLFLISTRAGGLGINLTAANRVIIFDASWNPSYDVQSIFRVYRFGQKKPCYVYRFLASGTMEEKIYNRQVTKLSLSCRVVDEQQIERHYRNNDLNELYTFEPNIEGERPTLNLPKDRLLAEIFLKYKNNVENYHEHDSLLENKAEEELNEEERKQAWLEYEEEKKGKPPVLMYAGGGVTYPNNGMLNKMIQLNQFNQLNQMNQFTSASPWMNINNDYEKLQELIRKDYPNATPEYQKMMTTRVLTDMYNYWEREAFRGTSDTIRTTQVPNIVRMPTTARNITSTSGQDKRTDIPYTYVDNRNADPKYGDDDDIVEVTPATTTTTGKNKNQEE